MTDLLEFKWSERDNRCAVIKLLVTSNFEMDNVSVARLVDVDVCRVQRVRANLIESKDISQVLERKCKELEDLRVIRSQDWVGKLQGLIDDDPTRSLCDLATEMESGRSTVARAIKEDLKSRSYRRQTGQLLTPALMARRHLNCSRLLNMLKHPGLA